MIDKTFTLEDGIQKDLINEFATRIFNLASTLSCELIVNGVDKIWAETAVSKQMLNTSVMIAILNRMENLEGEPDIELWRKASDKAFKSVLASVKEECTIELTTTH